jgi:cell division transport system ATP-binding protein
VVVGSEEDGRLGAGQFLIRLYNASKRYDNGRIAFRNVTLTVEPGELVLLTGPTGSGKSSLLKVLFGDEALSHGKGVVNGRNLDRLDGAALAGLRRDLGLVFQDARLIDRLSVLENVALAAEVSGLTHAQALFQARELLQTIGLAESAEVSPAALSAGERQRVSIARALIKRPVLLLADEPTANLDPDASLEIIELLKEVNRDGTTVVVATHDQDALDLLQCRTLMMYEGRLIEEQQALAAGL